LMTPFIAPSMGELFTTTSGPSLILRLNWTTALCIPWKYAESHTRPVMEPDEALSAGADVVLANLTLQAGDEKVDAENVRVFSEIARRKERAGVPLIGEVIPLIPISETERLHRHVKEVVRIAWELGADMIKTYYTGERFREVTDGVPIPVFALGGEKMKTEDDALKMAENAVRRGAAGVVFGRNVIQAADPSSFLRRLKSVVKDDGGK